MKKSTRMYIYIYFLSLSKTDEYLALDLLHKFGSPQKGSTAFYIKERLKNDRNVSKRHRIHLKEVPVEQHLQECVYQNNLLNKTLTLEFIVVSMTDRMNGRERLSFAIKMKQIKVEETKELQMYH